MIELRSKQFEDDEWCVVKGDLTSDDLVEIQTRGYQHLELSKWSGWTGGGTELLDGLAFDSIRMWPVPKRQGRKQVRIVASNVNVDIGDDAKDPLCMFAGVKTLSCFDEFDLSVVEDPGSLTAIGCCDAKGRLQQSSSRLPNIESIGIRKPRCVDLRWISEFPKVHELTIKDARALTSLEGIESLTELRELYVYGAGRLTDVSAVFAQPKLHKLVLEDCPSIATLRGIEQSEGLRQLILPARTVINDGDLSPFASLKNLEKFAIRYRRAYWPKDVVQTLKEKYLGEQVSGAEDLYHRYLMRQGVSIRSDSATLTVIPATHQADDIGAVRCNVEFNATEIGWVRGAADVYLAQLTEFQASLSRLRQDLRGSATLCSVAEAEFSCEVSCSKTGRVEVRGWMTLASDLGKLEFCFESDQSFLQKSTNE